MTIARLPSFENRIDRTSVEYMDNILGVAYPVLNYGHVRIIDYMGDDEAIVQAARMSYGRGTKTPSDDRSLIRYLMRHWHTGPLEMCELKLHAKMPMAIAEQWLRHRTASINKISGRYSILDCEFFVPEEDDMAQQSTDNKQGRGVPIDPEKAKLLRQYLLHSANESHEAYEHMIDPEGGYGYARELARLNLPASVYTEFYWKIDLHNLFHFLRLRAHSHAQKEIRLYAEVLLNIIRKWVPLATEAFEDYRLNSVNLSAQELTMIKGLLGVGAGRANSLEKRLEATGNFGTNISTREIKEFLGKLS